MLDQRLYISDLDGTLLGPDRRLGVRTRQVLERFIAGGGRFTLATGRSVGSTRATLDGFRPVLPVIAHNGAVVADLERGAVAHLAPLPPATAAALFQQALRAGITPVAYALPVAQPAPSALEAVVLHGPRPNDPTRRYLASVTPHHPAAIDDGARLAQMVPLSLILLDDRQRLISYFAAACEPAGVTSYAGHSAYTPGLGVGEIVAPGASKALAAAWLARTLDLDLDRVVAFGDNLNDLPLLEAAGEAYCPQDAPPDMLRRIPGRIPGAAEEGVAQLIQRLL